MILFKTAGLAQAILEGRKTVTRRVGKRRWKVGSLHLCYTRPAFARPPGEPFARVRIVSVTEESFPGAVHNRVGGALSWITACLDVEAHSEGFQNWVDFCACFEEMHGAAALNEPCWRVEFELVEVMRV